MKSFYLARFLIIGASNHMIDSLSNSSLQGFSCKSSIGRHIGRTPLEDFFRSDHYEFWNADPSLPTVFITDTADFGGFMKQCYHQSYDEISHCLPCGVDRRTYGFATTKFLG